MISGNLAHPKDDARKQTPRRHSFVRAHRTRKRIGKSAVWAVGIVPLIVYFYIDWYPMKDSAAWLASGPHRHRQQHLVDLVGGTRNLDMRITSGDTGRWGSMHSLQV